jgi:DNA polymerase-3 subunit delta'
MLANILGQPTVVAALAQSLAEDRLAQTYLFTGEHQVGKTTTALALAKVLLCTNRTGDYFDFCDRCAACHSIDAGANPDVRQVAPSGPSRMLRIPQFWPRDGIKDHPADKAMLRDVHYAPVSGKRRIFIIESAEAMNEDTANSLLKILEEPPPYALFILTALSPQAVLSTILSRSQVVRFRSVPEQIIAAALIARGIDKTRADILAAYAQGRPGIAIRALTTGTVFAGRDDVLESAVQSSMGLSTIASFKIADDLRKASSKLIDLGSLDDDSGARTRLTNACDILVLWYRDLLVSKSTNGSGRLLNPDRAETLAMHARRYTLAEIEKAIDLVQDTRRYIGRNANGQLATEYLMLNLLSLGARS